MVENQIQESRGYRFGPDNQCYVHRRTTYLIIFQNVVDMTRALRKLKREGYEVNREDVAVLSPMKLATSNGLATNTSIWGTCLNPWKAIRRFLSKQI